MLSKICPLLTTGEVLGSCESRCMFRHNDKCLIAEFLKEATGACRELRRRFASEVIVDELIMNFLLAGLEFAKGFLEGLLLDTSEKVKKKKTEEEAKGDTE